MINIKIFILKYREKRYNRKKGRRIVEKIIEENESTKYLKRINISQKVLSMADLRKIKFANVDFNEINLSGALLNKAVFINCEFNETNLKAAKVKGAIFHNCSFAKCDLRNIAFDEAKRITYCKFLEKNKYFGGLKYERRLKNEKKRKRNL